MKNQVMALRLGFLLGSVLAVFAQPRVNTTFGPLRGVWLKTRNDADVAGFLGLPYAEPPVGSLRFEEPRLWNKNWTGIRNATKDGSACAQIDLVKGNVTGSEDCLYLNVFTPTILKTVNKTKNNTLPVIVFLTGDGFHSGSSNSSLYAPTYLLDYDVVLVTLNYRLNVMGFFSTGNSITPGNYGLKDMLVALRWIKINIKAFGGDPNAVTLIGHGSAAAAIQILASSPKTEGLFHQLISMSGSPLASYAVQSRESMRLESMRVAQRVGCWNEAKANLTSAGVNGTTTAANSTITREKPAQNASVLTGTMPALNTTRPANTNVTATAGTNTTLPKTPTDEEIIECMKKADFKDIVLNALNEAWRENPEAIFGPTLEPKSKGAILTVHPVQSLKEGSFRDLPWITGIVTDEGLAKTTDMLLNASIRNEFIRDYKKLLVPHVLEMKQVFSNDTPVTEAIENFYFNNSISKNLNRNITQVVSDGLIIWPTYDFLQKRITKMKSNVYFYLFAYEGTFSTTFRGGYPYHFGVAHFDEINYLFPFFNTVHADLQLHNTLGDITMINILCEMWTNFSKTGKPSARLTPAWKPYQNTRQFMKLGNATKTDFAMEQTFLPDRMTFWDNLMKNFSQPIKEYRVEDDKNGSKGNHKSGAERYSVASVLCLSISIVWLCAMF